MNLGSYPLRNVSVATSSTETVDRSGFAVGTEQFWYSSGSIASIPAGGSAPFTINGVDSVDGPLRVFVTALPVGARYRNMVIYGRAGDGGVPNPQQDLEFDVDVSPQ